MKKVDNKEFLWYGLYAFAGFGLELLLLMFENMLIKNSNLFTDCLHYVLTSLLWGLMAYVLYQGSKKKLDFNVLNNTKPMKSGIAIALVLMVCAFIAKCFVCGGIKSVMEFMSLGLVKFIFQYIYYLFEVVLILLTITFGQRFFDGILKKENKFIPFGGMFLACTWGVMHILTQDFATGIYAFLMSVVYGLIYMLFNKNSKYSYLIIFIIFAL